MSDLRGRLERALSSLGVRPEKRRSQNFMISGEALDSIAAALPLSSGETAVEIGSGLGFLTERLLARGAAVVAVEKDRVLAAHLGRQFAGAPLRVVENDVLETDPERDLGLNGRVPVFANIPYHITTPILEWLIRHRRRFSAAAITMQKEVAERLTAKPGSKRWGSLSVFAGTYARIELVRVIGRGSFYPRPGVDSALVRFRFSESPLQDIGEEAVFTGAVRRAFQKRRKTLWNALQPDNRDDFYPKETISAALKTAGIDPARRPETLSIAEWAALSRALPKKTS